MSKICPICQNIFDDSDNNCPKHGVELIEISTTTIQERMMSETELNLDAVNQIRSKAKTIMEERGRIDSSAISELRPLCIQLSIDNDTFRNIIKEVRSYRSDVSKSLNVINARYLQQAQQAVQSNDMNSLSALTSRLEAMAESSQDDDVQYLYYLSLSIFSPIKSMEVYEHQADENYWRMFWAIISYIRTDKFDEASKLLVNFDNLLYKKSEDDHSLLEAYFHLMKNDEDGAQEFLDNIIGELSTQIIPLLKSIESKIYVEQTDNLEVRFYLEKVLVRYDDGVKTSKEQDALAHSLTEDEALELYNAIDKKSNYDKLPQLQKTAETGDVWGMFYYARLYEISDRVVNNLELAVEFYTKAATHGNAKAMNSLGDCYFYSKGVCQNYAEAVKWYKNSANAGNASAMFNLGICYEEGKGVNQNYDEAIGWYKKAADVGNTTAMLNLGICYEEGKGVNQNYDEAIEWYKKAVDAGNTTAMFNIGKSYAKGKENYAEAVKWYRKSADAGDVRAMCNLGVCYKKGKGVCQNYTEAVKWFKESADAGNSTAKLNLGICYEEGNGVDKNNFEAFFLYLDAAKQGIPNAMYRVAVYLINDLPELNKMQPGFTYYDAARWLQKAANAGNIKAMHCLGGCYENGIGVEQSYSEAVKWYRKAIDGGFIASMRDLGICYEEGKGVGIDYKEAAKWYQKAADAGEANAKKRLAKLKSKGVNLGEAELIDSCQQSANAGNNREKFDLGDITKNGVLAAGKLIGSLTSGGLQNVFNLFNSNPDPQPLVKDFTKPSSFNDNTHVSYDNSDTISGSPNTQQVPAIPIVEFPCAWITQINETSLAAHFHFLVHNNKDKNITLKFVTECLPPYATYNGKSVVLSYQVTVKTSFNDCEWKDYIYYIYQSEIKGNLMNGNDLRLKTGLFIYDDDGKFLGSKFINYYVDHYADNKANFLKNKEKKIPCI